MLWLKYHLQKPEKGFAPVPKAFAEQYAANEYNKIDSTTIDIIKSSLGSFENKLYSIWKPVLGNITP